MSFFYRFVKPPRKRYGEKEKKKLKLPPLSKENALLVLVSLVILSLIFPVGAPFFLLAGLLACTHYILGQVRVVNPDHIFKMGRSCETGDIFWRTDDEARQHILVIGNNNWSRLRVMLDQLENAFAMGSGCILIDDSGSDRIIDDIRDMAQAYGREDDVLHIDMLTGHGRKVFNPLHMMTPKYISEFMTSLFVSSRKFSLQNKDEVRILVGAVSGVLSWLEENEGVDYTFSEFSDHLSLSKMTDIVNGALYPDLPPKIVKGVKAYLSTLVGYSADRGYHQSVNTQDQHNQMAIPISQVCHEISSIKGGFKEGRHSLVRMADVFFSNRILLISIPPEETDGDVSLPGLLALGAIKHVLSGDGAKLDPVLKSFSHASARNGSPFIVAMNNIERYFVGGMALYASQARSRGISLLYGADLRGLKLHDTKEVECVIANTNTKMFIDLEERPPEYPVRCTLISIDEVVDVEFSWNRKNNGQHRVIPLLSPYEEA